jgi:hypothetical protein
MELNLRWHPTTMLRLPRSSYKPWKCRSWKMKTTLILYSKCLELYKPIHPKPMSAHNANLVLCWQITVSPALITHLNFKKYYKDIRCSHTNFLRDLIILCMKNKFNFTTCYIIHIRAFCSQWLFHCTHFKCLELCKPTYPELMFAHYGNSVLCGQTFISPTQITSLNHKKILQIYQGESYKFCCDLTVRTS